jgi:ATP-binding cassette, subfamily B, bacterial MsbA
VVKKKCSLMLKFSQTVKIMINKYQYLFSYIRVFKILVSINIFLMIMMALSQWTSLGLIVPLLESFSNESSENLIAEKIKLLFVFVGIPFNFNTVTFAFAIMIILRIIFEGLQSHYSRVLTSTFSTSLQSQMFDGMMGARLSFYYNRKVGELISTLFTSSNECGGIIAELLALFKGLFLITASLAAGYLISIEMTLFILVVSVFALILVKSNYKRINTKSMRHKEVTDEIYSYELDILSGIKTVKGFNNINIHKSKLKELLTSYKNLAISIMDTKIYSSMSLELLLTMMLLAMLWIVVNFFNVSMISLVTVLFIFIQIAPQVKGVNRSLLGIKQMTPHLFKVRELIKTSQSEKLPEPSYNLINFSSEICLNEVRFRYKEGDPEILKGINLTIKKGETIALVGNSGAGKTTLVDLIMRHHFPTSGQVIVDSKNLIEDISMESWRKQIAIVEQSPYIFNASIYQNILYGRYDSSHEEVYEAGRAAYADDFIHDLPNGYDSVVGNRGMKLSGGQQQRLALARALLMKPKILILDEATSALDTESEKRIQLAIENYKKQSTLIVIAHRLSTIVNSDKIVFLENGRIEESGNHESLIRLGKRYNDFYNLQYYGKKAVSI